MAGERYHRTPIGYPIHPPILQSVGSFLSGIGDPLVRDLQPRDLGRLPAGLTARLMKLVKSGPGTGPEVQRSVLTYFSPEPIGETTTLGDLLRAGGALFVQETTDGHDARSVIDAAGDRALAVKIGPYDAAFVHADAIDEEGTRTFNLYWSDGVLDFSLEANVDPADAIAMGQSLYCP